MNIYVYFKYINLFIFILFISNYVTSIKFENHIKTSEITDNHGFLVGYFTFTGRGVATLIYSISPFFNLSNYKLSIFPMAYDTYSNMHRIKQHYSQSSCNEFYKKAIFTVNLLNSNEKVALGRFSGGFAVAMVLSNKYSCPSNLKRFDNVENRPVTEIDIKVDLLNPNDEDLFTDHLSATDRGISQTLQILLLMYSVMSVWALYSIIFKSNVDIPLIIVIQKLACVIISIHISIYIILLFVYNRFSQYGVIYKECELAAEFLAIICRYIELYIVVSWTLSSQKDSTERCDVVAKVISIGSMLHTLMTAAHYCLLDNWKNVRSCSIVWDCEPHIFTIGFGNPISYYKTTFGVMVMMLNWITGFGGSLFVLHLLKLGFGSSKFSVRREYLSVFCSAALFWFWSYPIFWIVSSLITDYYQYKFVLFAASAVHLCAIPGLLRVTVLSPVQIEASLPKSVVIG